jgi:hypothetical protein
VVTPPGRYVVIFNAFDVAFVVSPRAAVRLVIVPEPDIIQNSMPVAADALYAFAAFQFAQFHPMPW